MSCSHPLKAFQDGYTAKGKKNLIIASYNVDHIEFYGEKMQKVYNSFVSPRATKTIKTFEEIPCGKCIGCRLEYSRQWANRCMMEMLYHSASCFITLTYDEEHVPYNDPLEISKETGEVDKKPLMSLRRKDFTDFIKRLRSQLDYDGYDKIRFFGCGEYGSLTSRPHYHIIIFGWIPNDMKFYKRSEQGYNYYNSEYLQKLWTYGYAVVGQATWETCAYTARYCMKKLVGNLSQFYKENYIEPEFITMSRMPGIGKKWYEEHKQDYQKLSKHYFATDTGNKVITSMRYLDKLFDLDNPEELKAIKDSRKVFRDDKKSLKMKNTTKRYQDMLLDEELNTIEKTKALVRKEF